PPRRCLRAGRGSPDPAPVYALGAGLLTTAVNIFRKSKSRLKTRDFAKSDGCRINSFGKHFPGQAMKNLDNSAENAVFPGCCICRRSSPQWSPDPAQMLDR